VPGIEGAKLRAWPVVYTTPQLQGQGPGVFRECLHLP